MKNIAMALLNAQKKIKNAGKDAKNPHYKNDYATLESVIDAVKDIANDCGIVIIQGNGADDIGNYVNTTVIHAESGESITSKVYLLLDKSNMQGLGSAITYSRRYSLAAMFCITQSDDDGNAASQPAQPNWSFKQFNDHLTPEEIGTPSVSYRIPFGKFKSKTLEEVPMKDLENYVIYLEDKAKKENKEIVGQVREFIDNAVNFINSFEQEYGEKK